MAEEYWRWTESRWADPDRNWRDAKIVTMGLDVGSVSTQAVVVVDGELYCYSNMRTGSDSRDSAQKAFAWAIEGTGLALENIRYTIATGYGRGSVAFAGRTVTEIACHARGANFMYGHTVRTVLDMGGQDCKAIRCDEKGKVISFLMNDKCAAGTGRGMELFADLLKIPLDKIGALSFTIEEEPPPVNSTCVIFARSEALALLREGRPQNQVIAAYCSAMAHRVYTLLERIHVEKDFAITGGVAKNPGVVKRLATELGILPLESPLDPQLAGALGAALLGQAFLEKEKDRLP